MVIPTSLPSDALETDSSPPPQIRQMLLVLQSVHQTPPVEQFYTLQTLVGKVVHPYLCMVHRSRQGSGRSKHVLDMETVCKF